MNQLRRITVITASLGVVVSGVFAGCASSDGRSLPTAGPDQTGTIVTTTTTTTIAGQVFDEPAAVSTTVAGTAAPTAAPTLPATPTTDAVTTTAAVPESAAPTGFAVSLPWAPDAGIPSRHSCAGTDEKNIPPSVQWANVPTGTVELALVMTDTSAAGFAHWIVTGLDPNSTGIPENALPATATNQPNDSGAAAYLGPCPTDGAPHSYLVEILALNQQYEATGGDPVEVIAELRSLAVATASQSGVFAGA